MKQDLGETVDEILKDVEKMIEHFEFLKNGNTIYREQ
jgi:hypothetical protein